MASCNGTSIDLFLLRQHWLRLWAVILSALGPFVGSHEISGGLDVGFGGHFSNFRRHWLCFSSLLSAESVAFGGGFYIILIFHCRQWQWLSYLSLTSASVASSTMALVLYLFGCWPIAIKSS